MSNPWDRDWLRATASLASIVAFLAALLPCVFGLLFLSSLLGHMGLALMTFSSPVVAIISLFPYQMKPCGATATFTILSVILVAVTWLVWLSDSAKGIIH